MNRWRIGRVLPLAALLLALLAAPGGAILLVKRYPFEAGSWIHLAIEQDGLLVEDVKFDGPAKLRGIVSRHDKPNRAVFVARNTSNRRIDPGIAVALFDKEDRLVAAGNTGVTPGLLQPGERHEFTVYFHGVFREMDQADHFLVSIEF